MLTQIEQQDPFEPTSNGEFIAQMAQFSTVSGIGDMQTSLENLSASFGHQQTLQASELVGRDVLVAGDDIGLRDVAAAGASSWSARRRPRRCWCTTPAARWSRDASSGANAPAGTSSPGTAATMRAMPCPPAITA